MTTPAEQRNVQIVLEAFDTLFNRREYAAAERFWSPNYIQHSAHIAPGRNGLFNLVESAQCAAVREPRCRGLRGVCGAPRTFLWARPAGGVDRRRRRAHGGRGARGTLGRDPRRGHPGAVAQRSADVRRRLSGVTTRGGRREVGEGALPGPRAPDPPRGFEPTILDGLGGRLTRSRAKLASGRRTALT